VEGEGRSRNSRDEIRALWTSQARRHGLEAASSWSDHRAIELEIRVISRHIAGGRDVLDAGCATGLSTAHYAALAGVRALGIDYVPEMIELAQKRREQLPEDVRERLEFRVGDVLDTGLPDGSFDRVVSTRVVINLAEWGEQRRAVAELARLLRPGGLLLLSEATVQGSTKLNELRTEWGLPTIETPSFNLYIDQDAVADFAVSELGLQLLGIEDFASSYYVATRVLKPLLARNAPAEVDVSDPDAEFNRWASLLPAAGDYGTQKLFVLRKP